MFKEKINFGKLISVAQNSKDINWANLNQFLALDPLKKPTETISFLKASKLYNEKKFDEALIEFKSIEHDYVENAHILFKIGMCYFKKGQWGNALKYFEKAKACEDYKESWNVQYYSAINHLEKSSSNLSFVKEEFVDKSDSDQVLKYAKELFNNKSYWVAIHTLNEFVEKNGTTNEIQFLLSNCYEILTDYENSIEILKNLLIKKPNNTNYIYRYAYNLEMFGEVDLANEYYAKFILLKKDDQDLRDYGIGVVHAKRGLWKLALKSYQVKQSQLGDLTSAVMFEKMAYAAGRQYLWKEAAYYYEKAIHASDYAHADLYFKCGEAFEKNDNLIKAAEFYEKSIERSNDFKDYWYYRTGLVLEQLKEYEKANKYFKHTRKYQTAYALNPKDILKTNEQKMLSFYTEYYENLEILENTILFESFFGDTVSCNPYALLLNFLKDHKFNHYKFIVVLNDLEKKPLGLKDDRIIFIKRQSDAYLRYLASAKYLINNVSFPYYFIRKEGQFYLNTWHGTPLKTLGKDIRKPLFDYANVARNFLHATHIISQNRYTNDILLNKYNIKDLYSGKIAETGYPRVDLTLNITHSRKKEILEILNLSDKKPIVVYAPTWRGTSERKDFDTNKLLKDLKFLNSNKYQLVFKCHHLAEAVVKKANLDITLVPHCIDTNELLGCADILISDYSSIVFDYLHCNKPIISYAYDFEDYVLERGMYVSKQELLGTVCTTIREVAQTINQQLYKKVNYKKDRIEFAQYDDGNVADRVKAFLFDHDETYLYQFDKKPVNLMFSGPYIPNGITRSFTNLLTNLKDYKDFSLSVIVNKNDINGHENRINEFNTNYIDSILYQARIGAVPMTAEETWIRSKFESIHLFYSKSFEEKYNHIYAREARRLFGDSEFQSVINFEGYSVFWVSLLSQIKSKRKIIFQHNDLHREWKTRFSYLQGVFNLYKYYHKVISVSELTMLNNIKNLAEDFNISEDKFEFLNNTIIPENICNQAKILDDIDPLFSNCSGKKLINIGRLSHEKDQEKLIRAFARSELINQDVKLFILGQGPLEEHLNNLINELGLRERVYLLGQVSNPYSYLKQSDLFVLSSNHEGQPMVLLEALTLGTPILATDIVGNRSVLSSMPECLVENTEDALAEALSTILNKAKSNQFDANAYNEDAINKVLKFLGN